MTLQNYATSEGLKIESAKNYLRRAGFKGVKEGDELTAEMLQALKGKGRRKAQDGPPPADPIRPKINGRPKSAPIRPAATPEALRDNPIISQVFANVRVYLLGLGVIFFADGVSFAEIAFKMMQPPALLYPALIGIGFAIAYAGAQICFNLPAPKWRTDTKPAIFWLNLFAVYQFLMHAAAYEIWQEPSLGSVLACLGAPLAGAALIRSIINNG